MDAIAGIARIVDKVNDYSTTIASAVEEQTATTAEMSRSITDAANSAGEITGNITGVADAATSTASAATIASQTTREVSTVVTSRQSTVSQFRY